MPVIFHKNIDREDLRRNPDVLYVFGDNVNRTGFGGQAAHMRLEKNAVGVATKYTPSQYFGDSELETKTQNRIIDRDMKRLFDHVNKGGIVVWPSNGIGTGLAKLQDMAPDTFNYLQDKLTALLKAAALFDKAHQN